MRMRRPIRGAIQALYVVSAGSDLRAADDKALVDLIEEAGFFPPYIPEITGLLRRKACRKPVPLLLPLLQPKYRAENLAIAAARSSSNGAQFGKEIFNAGPIRIRERNF